MYLNTTPHRFGFNGQEKDDEVTNNTGTDYTAEFWEYEARLGRRWNTDPKPCAELSVYACFANNPIIFCDALGDIIKFAPGTSEEFQQQYTLMVNYLRAHGAADIIDQLEASATVIYVSDVTVNNPYNLPGSYFAPSDATIYWNPNELLLTDNGIWMSASLIFSHEADHALEFANHREQFDKDSKTPDPEYEDKEERRVITGSEQVVARKLGEVCDDEITRTDHHSGTLFPSTGATSTDPDDSKVNSIQIGSSSGDDDCKQVVSAPKPNSSKPNSSKASSGHVAKESHGDVRIFN